MLAQIVHGVSVSDIHDPEEAYTFISSLVDHSITKTQILELYRKSNHTHYNLTNFTDASKIKLLRDTLKEMSLSGYIFSTNDEYISEYTPLFAKRLWYITGFDGSYGIAIVTLDQAALFVDGRYTEQAKHQVDTTIFQIQALNHENIINFCAKHLPQHTRIALNSKTNSVAFTNLLTERFHSLNLELQPLAHDLIDQVWENQPPMPISPVKIYPEEYSGSSATDKICTLVEYLTKENLDALLVTALDNIAWLLNIRGKDIECTPVALASLLVHKSGRVELFINPLKLSKATLTYLANNNVTCFNEEELATRLTLLKHQTIGVPINSPYFYFHTLHNFATIRLLKHDFIASLKAVKNQTERANSRLAHFKDGAAFTKLIMWINSGVNQGAQITELDVVDTITSIKSKIVNYQGNSFTSIVAANSNAAFPHYQSTPRSNVQIDHNTKLLIDCGAQYLEGTTDVTRTLTFKEPSSDFKLHFTVVLKGLIALSTAKFPKGTPGRNLDVLARQYVWQLGLNYNHGTGHGVGHFLSVHEGPISFNQVNEEPLQEGMILSIEPGLYIVGHYGIRLENLVLVKTSTENSGFLEFHTLTYIPIDVKNINFALLTAAEQQWLRQYHEKVLSNLTPLLNHQEISELQQLIKF